MSSTLVHRTKLLIASSAFTVGAVIFSGCSGGDAAVASGPPPTMTVKVETVKTESVSLPKELPGRVSAFKVAEVRARINGIVLKRLFDEGSFVKEGEPLFEIDPAPYQAAVDSALANLARAEASLASASAQAKRFRSLVETSAISQQTYDDAVASELVAKAEIAAAKAAVKVAEINLGYTTVTSPISGQIGRAVVTEGAYVQQASATLLATVQQLDPLYVDLNQSVDEVLSLKASLASGRLQQSDESTAKLSVILNSGQVYGYEGALQFSDISVNPGTGTVLLRGTVPNPDNDLLPGMFVRARISEGIDPNAILVSQSLVSRNSKGQAVVMVVGPDDIVQGRVVKTSRSVGNRWLVSEGLEPGDRIIVDNLLKVRPGIPVKPVLADEASESIKPQA